jgi:hypothetical protein
MLADFVLEGEMGHVRTIIALLGVVLLAAACGGPDDPSGAGGSGGDVGTGGTGGNEPGTGGTGGGGPGGNPVVDAFDPDRGGPGFRIRVHGRNLSPAAPKNAVFFPGVEGGTPTIESVGVAADPEGTWFEVDVPLNAKTGSTLVTVETAAGKVSVDGPHFVVTDERLAPFVSGINPTVITAGDRTVRVTLTGSGFYPNVTTLTVNGEDHPIDWSQSNTSKVVFNLPNTLANTPGTYAVQLHTPAPGGGDSAPTQIKVVYGINLVKAKAIAQRKVRLTFDRAVSSSAAGNRRNFSIVGRNRAIDRSNVVSGSPNQVELELSFTPQVNQSYTVRVAEDFTSAEGGEIQNREATFRSFGSLPLLRDEIGDPGCAVDRFSAPVSVTLGTSGELYVVERNGHQIKVLDRDGNFLGFYGHDGTSAGFHESGTTPNCGTTSIVNGGFLAPFGQAVETEQGLFVADLAGRVWKVTDTGMTVFREDLGPYTATLGLLQGWGLAVTTSQGRFATYSLATGSETRSFGGEPGTSNESLNFGSPDAGVPALAAGSEYYYVVDVGNHRVKRYTASHVSTGSIGAGSGHFAQSANGNPGTAQGEFTSPAGVALDANGAVYVSDSAGGTSGGGRIQRFAPTGQFGWEFRLDYVPGGIAIDKERDLLWVVNRSRQTLMVYELP